MIRLSLLLFFSCLSVVIYAQQTVFPGDANDNNIVDQYDLLSVGYAFGQTGAARIQDEVATIQGIPLFWEETFPDGTDFIYADCDGNGVVNYLDFLPLFNNYGHVLEDPSPLTIIAGTDGLDPSVIWNNGTMEVVVNSGTELQIPISIPLSEAMSINGLAFNLRYTPGHFQAVNFSNEEHWLAFDNQAMSIIMKEPGLIEVATTRFGSDPVTGGGQGGILELVIIIDMVDLLEEPTDTLTTKIYLEDILMIDGDFNAIPVAADTFNLKLYSDITAKTPNIIPNDLLAHVFPNPSKSTFFIASQQDFNSVEIIDLMGRASLLYNGEARKEWVLENDNLKPGLYHLKISGNDGVSILRLMVLE